MSRPILVGLLLFSAALADFPLPWERDFLETLAVSENISRNTEEIYRLPQTLLPLDYDIYIHLFFSERTDRPFSFDGLEHITIQAIVTNVTQIVLHANVDRINSVSLRKNESMVALNSQNPFLTDPEYQFLKINVAQPLEVGTDYILTIDYSSTMNEGPMKRGIWRGWYTDDEGIERIYATTHFQPYNARQAFPCWDEPLFKAVFRLHISRPNTFNGRFSNTIAQSLNILENSRVQDNFLPTPKMSSYLVTFLVSETFQVIAEDSSFTPPIRIIGRSNTAGLGNHALNLAVEMTKYFDEYFEIPYSSLSSSLMNDHIASPDWASAGTENWGMVSYRELHMIIDPRETLMSAEHYAATLVSHELAHKWFGNLITCYWWSNTWINEGFASYFGYIATNEVFPKYELHEHFNNRYLQTSLAYDSSVNTEPMNHEVNTPAQVTSHFGTISYSKAAAFLRMTVNIVTPETFRKACKYFLTDNAYESTNQTDLLEAFVQATDEDDTLSEYLSFDFREYYRIWVNEPGYPILNVDIDHATGDMSLSQERFFLSASATPTGQIYPIPITYSTKSNPNFEKLKPDYILSTDRAVLQKDAEQEWVIFNNLQHGHYRVNYDETTWDLIAEALLNEPKSIHYLNRAQIVDDIYALMRSGRMPWNTGFNILRFLADETNYHVWDPAITMFTWLRNRLRHIPDKQAEFDALVLSYLDHVIETVGFEPSDEETPTEVMTRQVILHFACSLKHEGCVTESRDRFFALRDNNEWVNVGIRRNVFVSGIREGGQEDFDFLLDRLNGSNFANDQLEMLRGLAATKDPELLNRYLQLTLTKYVRSHDKANSFNFGLLGNSENAYIMLQFVKDNIDSIRREYVEDSPARPVHTVLSNLASYLDEPGLVEYEEWLRSSQTHTAQYSTALSAITSARSNMAWGTANADVILAAVKGSATKVITSLALLFAMSLIAAIA